MCVHLGVAGGSDCPPKTPEPCPAEGEGPGQIQQIRRRGSASEVPLLMSLGLTVFLFPMHFMSEFPVSLINECMIFFFRCSHLSREWEELEEACNSRAAHLSKAITREQVRGTMMSLLFEVEEHDAAK